MLLPDDFKARVEAIARAKLKAEENKYDDEHQHMKNSRKRSRMSFDSIVRGM